MSTLILSTLDIENNTIHLSLIDESAKKGIASLTITSDDITKIQNKVPEILLKYLILKESGKTIKL